MNTDYLEESLHSEYGLEDQPSDTARLIAYLRALANIEQEIGGGDYLAKSFLNEMEVESLENPDTRQWVKDNKIIPGVYGYVMARTENFDRHFLRVLDEEIPQIVLLGAGYDSRPYRFSGKLKNTRIFELDVSTTQSQKIACLKKSKTPIPDNVSFVSINFNKHSLKEVLLNAGFQSDRRTLFLWEGVSMYLSSHAVDDTLKFVRSYSPAGSELLFDYIYRSVIEGDYSYYGAAENVESVAALSEPYTFGIHEGKIELFLKERGFKLQEHYTPSTLETDFLTDKKGHLTELTYGFICHTQAIVAD